MTKAIIKILTTIVHDKVVVGVTVVGLTTIVHDKVVVGVVVVGLTTIVHDKVTKMETNMKTKSVQ